MNCKLSATVVASVILAAGLSACGAPQVNVTDVQSFTAKSLGVAPSDVTITNARYYDDDKLGGRPVIYDVTLATGQRYGCSLLVVRALTPVETPFYKNWSCRPVNPPASPAGN